ncbi:MAG TPA: hypothetical protein VGM29_05525 [Polyangiaceae bacterium]
MLLVPLGCAGTTGDRLRDFPAAASGPGDLTSPLTFTTDLGWHVILSEAKLHVGAFYLDQSRPVSGAQDINCVLPGTYVAQETSGLDVDLLSAAPQYFPAPAHGSSLPAIVGQVWLTGGAIDDTSNATKILVVAGTAEQNGTIVPFLAQLTIGTNFAASGALAGAQSICKERIVSPIPSALTVEQTGGLLLSVDPRRLFVNVDFSELDMTTSAPFLFSNDPTSSDFTQPSRNLFDNLRSVGPYTFSWSGNL